MRLKFTTQCIASSRPYGYGLRLRNIVVGTCQVMELHAPDCSWKLEGRSVNVPQAGYKRSPDRSARQFYLHDTEVRHRWLAADLKTEASKPKHTHSYKKAKFFLKTFHHLPDVNVNEYLSQVMANYWDTYDDDKVIHCDDEYLSHLGTT